MQDKRAWLVTFQNHPDTHDRENESAPNLGADFDTVYHGSASVAKGLEVLPQSRTSWNGCQGVTIPRSVYTPAYQAMLALLRERRAAAGLSQRALASRLGKPPSYVHKCEVGERQINPIELRLWCHALGLSWLDFAADLEASLPPLPPVPTS